MRESDGAWQGASSRATDPVALGASVLFGMGAVVAAVCVAAGLATQTWLFAAVWLVLLVVFAAQTYAWSQAARCRIRVDERAVVREGPIGWRVERDDVERWEFVETRGRTYLAIVPRSPRGHSGMSRALLGKAVPGGSVVGPLAPDSAGTIGAALGPPPPGV